MELGTFKRLDDGKIALDGLVWSIDPEKAIEVKDEETGYRKYSVKYGNVYYYPCAIYVPKTKKNDTTNID